MKNGFPPLLHIPRLGLRCSTAALTAALFLSFAPSAKAATFCVDPTFTGCFTTISAAVAASSPGDVVGVSPGTYHEQVTITMPLTLIGNSPTTTIIDASGFSNGIIVDGRANPGLSQVMVRGFTIENANFEGVLAIGVNDLNISKNTVQNNDKNLHASSAICPGLPSFETGENADCGEGIHLMGVTHSTIAENLVTGNAGGILLSDETGASHDNLLAHNIVSDNPYSNGITLSSNAAAVPITAPQVTFGVYSNSLYENASLNNGIGGAGGGGVALLAVGAGHSVYSNSLTGNRMVSNGLAGVLVHASGAASGSTAAANAGSNSIVENFIASNGPDPAAGATTPTGVSIDGQTPVLDLTIYGNTFATETVDVFFNSASILSIHNNDLVGTTGFVNQNSAGVVNARENFWGCTFVTPGTGGCSNIVGPNVTYTPWLTASINPPPATTTPTPPTKGTGKGRHCCHDWFCDHYKEGHWFFGFLKDDCDHGDRGRDNGRDNGHNNNGHDDSYRNDRR